MAERKGILNIVDVPLPVKEERKKEVSLSIFAFLYAEIIKYCHHNERHVKDVERRLADMGYTIGVRLLELINWKEKSQKRETKLLRILFFISVNVWKYLFGTEATLEKSSDRQYMISEPESMVSKFISDPKPHPNSNYFLSGIVEGILEAAEFPAIVTAPSYPKSDEQKVIILIEFTEKVMEREALLDSKRSAN